MLCVWLCTKAANCKNPCVKRTLPSAQFDSTDKNHCVKRTLPSAQFDSTDKNLNLNLKREVN